MKKKINLITVILLWMIMISRAALAESVIEGVELHSDRYVNGFARQVSAKVSANAVRRVSGNTLPIKVTGYAVKGPFASSDVEDGFEEGEYGSPGSFEIKENGWYLFGVRDEDGECFSALTEVDCIDRTSPVITSIKSEPEGGGSYGLSSRVSVYAYDLGSRLHEEAFSFDDGRSFSEDHFTYVSENGVLRIRVRDGLGNVTRKSFEVSDIDRDPPSLSVTGTADETSGSLILNIRGADEASGISALWYDRGENSAPVYLGRYEKRHEVVTTLRAEENGIYRICAKDAVGNLTTLETVVDCIEKKKEKSSSKKSSSKKTTSSARSSSSLKPVIIGTKSAASSAVSDSGTIEIKSSSSSTTMKKTQAQEKKATVIFEKGTVSKNTMPKEVEEPEISEEQLPFYELEKEYIEGELYTADAAPEPVSVSADKVFAPPPENEKGVNRGAIIAAGIFMILILLALLLFALNKMGIIDLKALVERAGNAAREELDEEDEEDEEQAFPKP